jgi:hypothetical protein
MMGTGYVFGRRERSLLLLLWLLATHAIFIFISFYHTGQPLGLQGEICARRWDLGGIDTNSDRQFTFSLAAKRAPRGWNIAIVASNRNTDMALTSENIVRGIEADPA